jgi:competence protein ComGC
MEGLRPLSPRRSSRRFRHSGNRFLPRRRAGLTLIEALVVLIVVGVLLAVLLPSLWSAKRAGRGSVCISNIRQFGIAAGNYLLDFDNALFAFSWEEDTKSPYGDLNNRRGDIESAAAQAVTIMRHRGNRADMPASLVERWIPHVLYTHLVLNDYLDHRLPEPSVVCPSDKDEINWQSDPRGRFDQGAWLPNQPDPTNERSKRWPYGSSYQVSPASYDGSDAGNRVSQQGLKHFQYYVPPKANLGAQRMSEVRFPAQKVHLFDSEDRHRASPPRTYAAPEAAVAVLMFDGAAEMRPTSAADPGWDPNNPDEPIPTVVRYEPRAWEAPTVTRTKTEARQGYYRWTRGGLRGADFGGRAP